MPSAVFKNATESKKSKDESKSSQEEYRQKVLILSSQGVTSRMRHLMNDLTDLIPHSKKDAKHDSKQQLYMLNEVADLNSCNNVLFFEARRHNDLYLWASKAPNGPSIRFHVLNIHTMDELKMTGNCLKGSRPIVTFDSHFDAEPHLRLIKESLTHIFAVPKTARKAKPFVDHVINFSIVDGNVWFRNYQIIHTTNEDKRKNQEEDPVSLSEIGPRFVLVPVKIFEGSFAGTTIYENENWVSPTELSVSRKNEKAARYGDRKDNAIALDARKTQVYLNEPQDDLDTRKVFS